jgi:hypothetical protein
VNESFRVFSHYAQSTYVSIKRDVDCVWTERQAAEIFHLLFLRAFGARVDKALFALKGGCNLRFFLKSIRYSQDMDLDIQTMAVGTLRNNVNRLLADPAFLRGLRTQDLEVVKTYEAFADQVLAYLYPEYRLRTLATPAVESRDVAALLQVSASNATTILRRLASRQVGACSLLSESER